MVCDLASILQLDELLREQLREGDASLPQRLSVHSLRRPFSSVDIATTAAAAQRLLLVACRQVHPNSYCFLIVPPFFLIIYWSVRRSAPHARRPFHMLQLISQLPDGHCDDRAIMCVWDAFEKEYFRHPLS